MVEVLVAIIAILMMMMMMVVMVMMMMMMVVVVVVVMTTTMVMMMMMTAVVVECCGEFAYRKSKSNKKRALERKRVLKRFESGGSYFPYILLNEILLAHLFVQR